MRGGLLCTIITLKAMGTGVLPDPCGLWPQGYNKACIPFSTDHVLYPLLILAPPLPPPPQTPSPRYIETLYMRTFYC